MPPETLDLLHRLKPQLRRLALRSTCCEVREGVDDLITDLYLRLTDHPMPAVCNAEPYAVEAYKNLVRDRERAHRRRCRRERAVAIQRTCDHPLVCDLGVLRDRSGQRSDRAETWAIRRETRRQIQRAVRLAKLRPDHCCALWAWLRNSLKEFADRRGIPQHTAAVWATRARRALRPHLEYLRRDIVIDAVT